MDVDSDSESILNNTDIDDLVLLNDVIDETFEEGFIVNNESSCIVAELDEPICSIAFNPINSQIISFGGCNDKLYVKELPSDYIEKLVIENDGKNTCPIILAPDYTLSCHNDTISSLGFSYDGNFLASASYDSSIVVFDSLLNKICTLDGPSKEFEFLKWAPQSLILLAGSADGSSWIWSIPNGDLISVMTGYKDSISCGDFINNRNICLTSLDGTASIHEVQSGKCVYKFNNQHNSYHTNSIVSLACNKVYPIIGTGSLDTSVCISHCEKGKILKLLSGHTESVETMEFINNSLLISGDMDGKVIIWDTNTFRSNITFNHDMLPHSNGVKPGIIKLKQHPNNPNIIVTGCIDGTIRIWDIRNSSCYKTLFGHTLGVLDFDISFNINNFTRIISAGDDGKCLVWDLII